MSSILFTGFPGFLASELLPRVLHNDRLVDFVRRYPAIRSEAMR